MIKYKVTDIPEAHAQMIQGDFLPGSIPVYFPKDERLCHKYISLFLNQKDIETGLDSLFLISENLHPQIVYSLFTTAIVNLLKCFQNSKDRVPLNKNTFLKKNKDIAQDFERYEEWRNNYFVHDGNGMMESRAFLLVAPEESQSSLGGPVSVVWRTALNIDYYQEAKRLEGVMQSVWRFVSKEIDSIGEMLYQKYSGKSREELLSYGVAGISCTKADEYSVEEIKAMRPKVDASNGQAENAQP